MRGARARRGSVAVIVAAAAVPLLLAVGVAVDLTRLYVLNSRLVSATDAAALAGARALSEPAAERDAQIRAWFWANFGRRGGGDQVGYMDSTVTGLVITPEIDKGGVRVAATATLPTTFTRLASLLNLSGEFTTMTTRADQSASQLSRGMELSLVLDTTGSMRGAPIRAMRDAATEMVNSLYGGRETVGNLWVAMVPYVASVNVGRDHQNFLRAGTLDQTGYAPTIWRGCVEARHQNRQDETDAPPGVEPFRPFLWRSTYRRGLAGRGILGDNAWTATNITEPNPENPQTDAELEILDDKAIGPNLTCPRAVRPLTRERSIVLNEIASLRATRRGGTMANLGLQMGWATLSPRWRGWWDGSASPLDYGTRFVDKVLVLMTDGVSEWADGSGGYPVACTSSFFFPDASCVEGWKMREDADYTAYGRLGENRLGLATNTNANATAEIERRMTRLCTNIKNAGITVYTITFALGDVATQELYRGCASKPEYYYDSPDTAALRSAFRGITGQLANLRLTR